MPPTERMRWVAVPYRCDTEIDSRRELAGHLGAGPRGVKDQMYARIQLANSPGWTLGSLCGGLLYCLQLEGDLVGRELKTWESRDCVA